MDGNQLLSRYEDLREEWRQKFAELETTEWGGYTDDHLTCLAFVNYNQGRLDAWKEILNDEFGFSVSH